MKYCPYCGSANNDAARFCGSCGKPFPATMFGDKPGKPASGKSSSSSFVDSINDYVGNDRPADLNWRMLFTDVFKHHTTDEAEEIFICGTKKTTPSPQHVSEAWPRPWLYSRVLATFLIAFVLLWICADAFANTNALPGMIVIGSFAVPLSTMILFMETNVWRNVSLFHILQIFLVGGCASLVATLFLFSLYPVGELDFIGAFSVGIIEEVGKAVIVYIFLRRLGKLSILTGLLVGGAVGAGFAAFESAGYGLQPLMAYFVNAGYAAAYGQGINPETMIDAINQNIFLRGILAPGGHVAWAAITGAAMVITAKARGVFDTGIVSDGKFLRLFAIPVVLHGLWDCPLNAWSNEIFPFAGCIALVALVWIVVLILINMGLSEVSHKNN